MLIVMNRIAPVSEIVLWLVGVEVDSPLLVTGNFPPPTTPEELGARILIQERYEKFGESEEVEMEVESDDEDEKQEKTEETPSQLDQDTQVQDMDEVSNQSKSFQCSRA